MSVELNHTIVPAKDKWVSAKFLADILNLEAGPEWAYKFAPDSPLEGNGFENSVPRCLATAISVGAFIRQ
jgi:hypothetical protein